LDLGHTWFLCRWSPQLIWQSMQDFPVGIDMRQRTLSYLYACYPLPSMIYQVSIKTFIYCLRCCISSKHKKRRRLVTATEVVVPSKDTELIVPSRVTETIVPSKTNMSIVLSKATETISHITCMSLVTGIASKIGRWIIKMLFTFLLHA